MFNSNLPIFLASKSPRRKKLLKQINLKFNVVSVDLEEKFRKGEKPSAAVKRIALEKMIAAERKINHGIIITADTIVVLDNEIIGKPKSKADAFRILKKLSGRTHYVFTGFAVKNTASEKLISKIEKTAVKFRNLSESEIKEYIANGSPLDKAGAYGIQDDYGAVFVEKINGCYYNVVGMPLSALFKVLNRVS